jgi:hypothetical protein
MSIKNSLKADLLRLVALAKQRHTCHKKRGYEAYLKLCKAEERKPLPMNSFVKVSIGAFYNEIMHEAWKTLDLAPRTKRAVV